MTATPVLAAMLVAMVPQADWQQRVHYTIEARLDEEAEVLRAAAVLDYENASPDTLHRLYFHLHLNAFRPHSLWARTEQRENYDFGGLEEPDYGYERLRRVTIRGRAATPVYPEAPDSTVVRFDLAEPLPPGERARIDLEWEARPSTLCRRQCRGGRHYDFAQWYPRVAVYDRGGWQAQPLLPQGEFYGEFGTFDVTLDLADDQVVGATGVPIAGDPGWRPTETSPVHEVRLRRDAYVDRRRARSSGYLDERVESGRKRVRFYADDVHHFAWSVDPEFKYEGGRHGDVAVHVLLRPGDLDWDLGVVVRRAIRSLSWLETIFGPYPYPQYTILHRLEGGGTEFPMLVMNGGSSQGLITHETAHQFAHGILGNNEWKEAWLDEGMATFVGSWFNEAHGVPEPWAGLMRSARAWDRSGRAEAIATPAAEFADYGVYGGMSYTKPAVVLYMLRELLGRATMKEALNTYYARYRFRHVTEEDLRSVIEEVSGQDLGWFFQTWLHTTETLDYAVGAVDTERADGAWRTRVEVVREGGIWMPVTVKVGSETRTLQSRDRTQVLEVVTSDRPSVVEIDPDRDLLEVDRSNNRREL